MNRLLMKMRVLFFFDCWDALSPSPRAGTARTRGRLARCTAQSKIQSPPRVRIPAPRRGDRSPLTDDRRLEAWVAPGAMYRHWLVFCSCLASCASRGNCISGWRSKSCRRGHMPNVENSPSTAGCTWNCSAGNSFEGRLDLWIRVHWRIWRFGCWSGLEFALGFGIGARWDSAVVRTGTLLLLPRVNSTGGRSGRKLTLLTAVRIDVWCDLPLASISMVAGVNKQGWTTWF